MVRRALSRHWSFVVGMLPYLPVPTSCSALFLLLGSLMLIFVVWYLLSLVPRLWGCGVDGCSEKGRFSCTVSVAHAFFNGMGDGFLLTCLVVGILGAGVCEVFACSRLPISLGRADWWWHAPVHSLRTLVCDFGVLALVRCVSSSALPAGLDIGPAGPGLVATLLTVQALQWFSHKGPHSETPIPSGNSDGVLFP